MEARFVPPWMLDGELPDVSREAQARLVDAELQRLRSLDAQLAVAMGVGIGRLLSGERYRKLFHPRIKDFVQARYGVSVGTAYNLRDLGEKLQSFPLLKQCFEAGQLCETKVRALLRIVTPETESGWVAVAQQRSATGVVQAVQATLRSGEDMPATDPAPDDEAPKYRAVSWLATTEEAAAWFGGLEMLRMIAGEDLPTWRLAELLVAGVGLVADVAPPAEAPDPEDETKVEALEPPHPGQVFDESRLAALATLLRLPPAPEPIEVPDASEPEDPFEIHERVAAIQRLRSAVDFERAVLLSLMHGRRLAQVMGFPTVHAYALRRLGMSGKDTTLILQRELESGTCPAVARAWHEGLPASIVSMITRVANLETAAAWLEFAQACTHKRLVAELRWHEMALAVLGRQRYLELTGGEPDASVTECMRILDWEELLGVRQSRLQAEAAADGGNEPDPELAEVEAEMSKALTPISFRAPEEIAELFRAAVEEHRLQVEAHRGFLPSFGMAVHSMLVELAHERSPLLDKSKDGRRRMREHAVFIRDGFRCQTPECTARRNLEAHHVRWRSLGGCDEPWNKSPHCLGCHGLIHDGVAVLTGTAPDDLTYRIGRRPDGSWRETWKNGLRVKEAVLSRE